MPPGEPPLLITGATSLIGRALDRIRPELDALRLTRGAAPGPDWLSADLADPELAAALEGLGGCGTVLGLSPIWTLAPAVPALAKAGARRIIAFSSTSRWTKTVSPVAEEREIAERLARAEADFIAACEAAGIVWTLFRPTLIYDEGHDGNVTRLAGLIRRFGVLPLIGGGRGLRQPVHAEDLAQAALGAIDAEATFNKAYDLPGGETLTYREMGRRIFAALGRPPLILDLPGPAWRLAFALARPFLPGATLGMGVRMAEDLCFDAEPAQRDFGWTSRPFRPRFRA